MLGYPRWAPQDQPQRDFQASGTTDWERGGGISGVPTAFLPPGKNPAEVMGPHVTPWDPHPHHDGDVMALVVGQGPVHAQQEVLGLPEAAEILGVQPHDHGDVVHPARRDEGFDEELA